MRSRKAAMNRALRSGIRDMSVFLASGCGILRHRDDHALRPTRPSQGRREIHHGTRALRGRHARSRVPPRRLRPEPACPRPRGPVSMPPRRAACRAWSRSSPPPTCPSASGRSQPPLPRPPRSGARPSPSSRTRMVRHTGEIVGGGPFETPYLAADAAEAVTVDYSRPCRCRRGLPPRARPERHGSSMPGRITSPGLPPPRWASRAPRWQPPASWWRRSPSWPELLVRRSSRAGSW